MKKIIFATANEGKLKEIRTILKDTGLEVISMEEAGITEEIEETGKTFEENAVIKAMALGKLSDAIVMADDSGLEIDFLDGEPGIYSARYAGEDTPYSIKNQLILDRMKEAEGEARSARFVCAIAAVFPDGRVLTTRGTIEGHIAKEPSGDNGFGYDPIFYVKEYGCTTASLPMDLKNELSHRGKALREMKEKLQSI